LVLKSKRPRCRRKNVSMSRPGGASADVVVVGAGAAGCVIASRLSEDPSRRVLLIEAGIDTPPGHQPADILDSYPVSYSNPAYFWPDSRASAMQGRAPVPYLQPRVMGGGSSVMGMWALRGVPADYDAWRDAGASGWSWEDVLPAFKRIERDLNFGNNPLHGSSGPIPVRRHPRESWPLFARSILEACERHDLPFREDINADFADGIFPVPVANDENGRVSSAAAYLTQDVRRRTNLKIMTGVEVTRLILEDRRVVGAETRSGSGVGRIDAPEIVLAAGAIQSPALLLRSGLGCAKQLKALGVEVKSDIPAVGRGLQNHCVVNLATFITPDGRQSAKLRTYGLACARVSSRIPGAPAGDLHLQFIAKTGAYSHGDRVGIVGAALYAPVSRGFVELTSPDPRDMPSVNFNLLSEPLDRLRMRKAVALGIELLNDPAVASIRREIFTVVPTSLVRRLNRPTILNRILSAALSAALDAPTPVRSRVLRNAGKIVDSHAEPLDLDVLLESVVPVFHPSGSCKMGAPSDDAAVVDPQCRVRGINGLRVADASIMPFIPRANTCLPAMMVGEHASAVMIRDTRA
jgi:5-(hydroxymethyl)furfural/furfural oxidase